MSQNTQKQAAANAALNLIKHDLHSDMILGIGTGSTANFFIDALANYKGAFKGAVSSSAASAERLEKHGITVFDLNSVESIEFYIDGADETNKALELIKGGGGALTREKIVAAVSKQFICIADESKLVSTLGHFPLPVEVIPMARMHVSRELAKLGGKPVHREGFVTDNGNHILDIQGLRIENAEELETQINQIVGVVANGLFAARGADTLILGTPDGASVLTPA